ncbi:hypothetical protein MRB53_040936 [Persea americana]|nr:hypothetical protein MRB53_040936 [Persea americana]
MIVQAVERLREDAQKLLLSRKRKLAELYDLTVCRSGRPQNAAHDLYFKQLQAFQDANDLQKGLLFNESSLPPRRESSRRPLRETLPENNNDVEQKSIEAVSPAREAPQPVQLGSSRRPSRTLSPQVDAAASATSAQDARDVQNVATNSIELQATASQDVSLPPRQAVKPSPLADESPVVQSHQNIESGQQLRTESIKNPIARPSTEVNDVQSSPTSSRGRPASHTPGPEAASPTTSPGDDATPTLEIMNMKPPEPRREEPQTPDMITAPSHKMSISSIDVDMIDVDPSTAFDSPVQPMKHPPTPAQGSRSNKPSISIDTQSENRSCFDAQHGSTVVETPGPMTGHNSVKQTPASTPAIDSSRRATRISSGALLKKSVSEILGETPRPSSPSNDSSLLGTSHATEKDRKEKDKSRLSTVVFAKPQRSPQESDTVELVRTDQASKDIAQQGERDYMYTLFESKAHSQSRQGTMTYLLQHSHKTISTNDHLVDYHYQAHCRVLKRLYQLQNLDKWSLRQRKRAEEPVRQTSHWDFLIDHAKWMRTDFREERRWKLAAARAVAEACAEWVAASTEGRKLLQITAKVPKQIIDADEMDIVEEQLASSPPGLEPHGEDDSVSEDIPDPRDIVSTIAPAAIFSLGATDFTFTAEKTPAFDKLLNELPLYQPARIEPDLSKSNLAEKLDARWKTDIVPVSKYATEKLQIKEYKPPFKRSRYDYNVDDSPPAKRPALEPRKTGVALFMPENKHIRDRIHPGHAFRPPAEHPMPSQSFFETRMSSQWLSTEDDEVRRQAREYSFNWTLISELMMPPTLYTSGQDRRTAWECFERWIGLEGMPADMAKTPYFKTYSNRIETAQRNVQSQWEEHERRNGTTPGSGRRKTTLPVRVERKHNRRHLFMLDAMRKLAKKREAVRQKAAHSADMAAMRKNNDVNAPRPSMRTPAEWSQLKFEREQKIAKQQEMYKQQLMAHQRAVVQQQRQGPNTNTNGAPVPMPGPPNGPNQMRMPMPVPNGVLQVPNGQPRPHPNMLGIPGLPPNMGMPMVAPKGTPQSGMANGFAGSPQQARPTPNGQSNGTFSSPHVPQAALANGPNNGPYVNMNQNMNHGSPNNMGNHGSPRAQAHMQSLSSGPMPKINQLFVTLRERHPNLPDEEIQKLASQQLMSWSQQQHPVTAVAPQPPRPKGHQAALNAARGAVNAGQQSAMTMNAMNATYNEQAQQYHQRMRQNHTVPRNSSLGPSASMSPMMNVARPVSQHSQASVTGNNVPREQRSASVTTQANTSASNVANDGGQPPVNSAQPAPVPPTQTQT